MIIRIFRKFVYLFYTLFFLNISALATPKNDHVILMNGDHITCEIKKLEFGILVCKTDDMGTVNIEWTKINSIISQTYFKITTNDGRFIYGKFDTTNVEGSIKIKGEVLRTIIKKNIIIKIEQFKFTFWEKLKGKIKLGFSYTKATDISNLNFNTNLNYLLNEYYFELEANSNISTKPESSPSKNEKLSIVVQRLLEKNWTIAGITSIDQNTELGINFRAQTGAGAGYRILESIRSSLRSIAGIMINRESYTDSSKVQYIMEALINTEYRLFIFHDPKVNLITSMNLYPAITDWGRIRTNFQTDLEWEIISDFTWNLSFYLSTDNRSDSQDLNTVDWNIVTSIGYSL